jgi:hypothetical protein
VAEKKNLFTSNSPLKQDLMAFRWRQAAMGSPKQKHWGRSGSKERYGEFRFFMSVPQFAAG